MLRGRYGLRWMLVAWLAIFVAIALAIWLGVMVGGAMRAAKTVVELPP